jgi:hypothetical protein
MMRTLLLALVGAVVLCGCRPIEPTLPDTPGVLRDGLKIVDYDPNVPAKLRTGDRLTMTVDYRIRSCAQARIFARPYTGGTKTPGYGAHPSPLYTRGEGRAVCWFTFDQPAVVDEVRVEMVNEATGQVVESVRYRIKAQWAASPEGLKILDFEPDVPVKLETGQRLAVTVAYRNKSYDKVRIFVRPYTRGKKTPEYGAHSSPIYTRGSGEATGWFTLNSPGAVDEVRVEMIDEATGKVVAEARRRIKAQWTGP